LDLFGKLRKGLEVGRKERISQLVGVGIRRLPRKEKLTLIGGLFHFPKLLGRNPLFGEFIGVFQKGETQKTFSKFFLKRKGRLNPP